MRFVTIFLGLVYSVVCLAQIDTHALESILNSTFTEVVGYHDFLELNDDEDNLLSKLTIDHEYSNFDMGRVKAELITQTTPLESNLNERLYVSANLKTDVQDLEDGNKYFDVEVNVDILGNTLAVLKSVSDVLGECSQKPIDDESTNSDHIGNILCFVQTGINESATVVELQPGIQAAIDYAKEQFDVDSEEDSLIGDLFSSLEINAVDGDLILNVEIDTSIGQEENTSPIKANISLAIKETGLALSLNGNAVLSLEKVTEYIDLVKNIATELQDRDSDTHITYYEDNLYLVFGLLEAFLVIEDEEDF